MKLLVGLMLIVIILEAYNCAPNKRTKHRQTTIHRHPHRHHHTSQHFHKTCRPCRKQHNSVCCFRLRNSHVLGIHHHNTWKRSRNGAGQTTTNIIPINHAVIKLVTVEQPVTKTIDIPVDKKSKTFIQKNVNNPTNSQAYEHDYMEQLVAKTVAIAVDRTKDKTAANLADKFINRPVDPINMAEDTRLYAKNFMNMANENPFP